MRSLAGLFERIADRLRVLAGHEALPPAEPLIPEETRSPPEFEEWSAGPHVHGEVLLDRPPAFEIGAKGETILRAPGGIPPIVAQQAGRTVERGNCHISAFFGLVVRNGSGDEEGRHRFSRLQPEVTLTSNGALAVRIAVTQAGQEPGTLTITVTRSAAGAPAIPPRVFQGTFAAVTAQIAATPELEVPAPPGMDARNRVANEEITATVSWRPAAGGECFIEPPERLRVIWNYQHPAGSFTFIPPTEVLDPRRSSSVCHGRHLVEEPVANGGTRYTVAVQSFFVVPDAARCCGAAGEYAVIQFVRHLWSLNEARPKRDEDTWTLDVLDGEGQRARGGQPYDPTYTHNPRGTAPNTPPVVYPGPNGAGAPAINQVDRPGIPPELYRRFARAGGSFTFEFLSLLVCRIDPSLAASYMATGHVSQTMHYRISINFPGMGAAPTVSGVLLAVNVFDPCRTLQECMNAFDRQNGRRRCGRLADGYGAPRGHQVAIPR